MEDTPQVPLATKCAHPDRPLKARGMCQSCYRAALKADDLASGKIKLDEETGADAKTGLGVEKDFVNDPTAVQRFYAILWNWLEDSQKADEPIITTDSKGKPQRNFQLEARMRESTDQRAMKAATVLGRAYIAERHVEEKPADLGVEGLGEIAGGWLGVAASKGTGKKSDA
jgi:hypothetical protein